MKQNLACLNFLRPGTQVYCTLLGEVVSITSVNRENKTITLLGTVQNEYGNAVYYEYELNNFGQLYSLPNAECIIFPSREVKSWFNYTPIPGDLDVVWGVDNEHPYAMIGVYDADGDCLFDLDNMCRGGRKFDNYELFNMDPPQWLRDKLDNLIERYNN